MTVFADLSNEEYQQTYLGTRLTKTPGVFANEKAPVNAPASVDWRQQNAVTPIKNQGQCMHFFLALSSFPSPLVFFLFFSIRLLTIDC